MLKWFMIIFSIETSCDETAVAIVKFSKNKAEVLANVVSSQIKAHSKFGGVVPSLASRMHLKNMVPVIRRAFNQSKVNKKKIDYFAVTNGPGLIPALIIGTQAAKTLSYALNKPLIPIHHIEGHIYANWLRPICVNSKLQISNSKQTQNSKLKTQNYDLLKPKFPILCLTVSGGHTQLIFMQKDLSYRIIGETIDDAAGEAFDKVAKILNLGYPGGPSIEKMAKSGNSERFNLPRPMIKSLNFNFSFSGLKTAVLYEVKRSGSNMDKQYKKDMAASFQGATIDVLISKTIKAAKKYKAKTILLGGGVSANKELREKLNQAIKKEIPLSTFHFPLPKLSTDNALMISVAAYKHVIGKKEIKSWKNVEARADLEL
jgi:N6-L-threonylcarbamoyladenine synthase